MALFYFVFEGNFPRTSPRGAYIWRGDLEEGFSLYPVWGAYIGRGLYMEGLFFGILRYVKKHIYGEGITDVFKTICKKLFGKTVKEAAETATKKAVQKAATKTGEYAGEKEGDKII